MVSPYPKKPVGYSKINALSGPCLDERYETAFYHFAADRTPPEDGETRGIKRPGNLDYLTPGIFAAAERLNIAGVALHDPAGSQIDQIDEP
ncbi:MAG: hypothetical protein P1V20_20955 [Verrucomicrobiales bacterium]|nr:hypothetical protein [Verrucomicrobiales bacterium]